MKTSHQTELIRHESSTWRDCSTAAHTQRPRIQMLFYGNPDGYPPIINSTRLLVQAGYCVDIFCADMFRRTGPAVYGPHVHISRLPVRLRSTWHNYLQFVLRVFTYAHRSTTLFIGHDMHGLLPAALLSLRYQRPLLYHCHDFVERRRALPVGGTIVRTLEERLVHRASQVIVPDGERAGVVVQELRLKHPPLVVANAPIRRFTGDGTALRQALAAQGKHFRRILFRQGSIGPHHAIEATLRSIPFWQSDAWGFVLMGYGSPDYIEHLYALAAELKVTRQFAVLPRVGYDELEYFTPGADAGHGLYDPAHINNMHITTASNKIMEYMAAGLPLLVSDRPGLRRLVETHHCGVVADESDPASIALAVNTLLNDPQQAKQMGAAALHAFETQFCYEQQFAPVLNWIHTVDVSV